MSSPNGAGCRTFRWHYILSALASIALSVWGAYATSIPNPDASLYLRAAEYFSAGRWVDGMAVYRWPLYSLLISGVMSLTGLQALLAAQVVNAILTLGTTVTFVALAYRLTNGDRAFVTVATIMIVFQPQLTELRSWVIRDNGYLCFFLVAIYFAVSDNQQPSLYRKIALLASLVAATLFRIEGFYLAALIAVYYVLVRLRTVTQQASTIAVFVIAASAILPFMFGIWTSGTFTNWIDGKVLPQKISIFGPAIIERVEILEKDVLVLGSGHGWQAYIAIAVGLALIQIVRALTPVYTFFGLFAFLPHRLLPQKANLPVVWFALGQLPMLILFTFMKALLDWRYAMGFALIAMFATVACATTSWRELLMGRPRAFLVFPSIIIAVGISWYLDIPRQSRLSHYMDAATWIRENVPPTANIWMNEPRIAYFSGHTYRQVAGVADILSLPRPTFEKKGQIDVFVFATGTADLKAPFPNGQPPRVVQTFFGTDGNFVQVFAVCPAMTDCNHLAKPAARPVTQ